MGTLAAIRIENLGKRYRITDSANGYRTLRESLTSALMSPLRRSRGLRPGVKDFWALKDATLEIYPGDVIGIIGRNGAGKSTLLKILSRVTKPTTGSATLHGRVGSLLEVGTGFHPELTGRENIFLNGAILGMSRREIIGKFDEIVEFAEVSQFLDTPVKRYSSGMYVRLAFAVAAHLEPEILIVDEVLAVGDAAFQRKCLGKMGDVARQGRTILFVSHNMAAITRLCKSAVLLNSGTVEATGSPDEMVSRYLVAGDETRREARFGEGDGPGNDYIRLRGARVRNNEGMVATSLDFRMPFGLEIEYEILARCKGLRVGLSVFSADGRCIFDSLEPEQSGNQLYRDPGVYSSGCTIPGEFLNYGRYYVTVGSDFPSVQSNFFVEQALTFDILETGGAGADPSGRGAVLRPNLAWQVDRLR